MEQTYDYRDIVRAKLYKNSNIPSIYLNTDTSLRPENVDVPAFDRLLNIKNQCARFVREHWHLNLYSSNVGNGKTSWAVKIMKNYIDTYACMYDIDCLFINVPEFMDMRKRSITCYNPQYAELEKRAKEARLVIFDEIASKHSSEFDEELLYRIINYRSSNGKSTIYTSNVLPEELSKLLGARIADRIAGSPNTVNIELKGGSRRNIEF